MKYFVALMSCMFISNVCAEISSKRVLLSAGVESHNWEEHEGDIRLVDEWGVLTVVGFDVVRSVSAASGCFFGAGGRFYGGDADYSGQTMAAVLVSSVVDYSGYSLELKGGYLLYEDTPLEMALFSALGRDHWDRDIRSSVDASGGDVAGVSESYIIDYIKLGVEFSKGWPGGELQMGGKLPLSIDVQTLGVTLTPGRSWSLFASYRHELYDNIFLLLSYEGWRMDASPSVLAGSGDVIYQPESERDSFGIRAEYSY